MTEVSFRFTAVRVKFVLFSANLKCGDLGGIFDVERLVCTAGERRLEFGSFFVHMSTPLIIL